MVQRMRAPRHGFSQLAASFLAYPRPGIPRAPLLRLTSSNCSLRSPRRYETERRNVSPPRAIATTAAFIGPVHRYVSTYQRSSRFLDDPNHPNCQISAGTEVPFFAAHFLSCRAVHSSGFRSGRQALVALNPTGQKRTQSIAVVHH